VSQASPNRQTLASLVSVLERARSTEEPNEEIAGLTILHHGLQCAALLAGSDPDDVELQVAGLFHDVGHVLLPGGDDVHGAVGAAAVAPVFGERVAALVEGHVAAKRYLVAVDDSYRGALSEGSLRTLGVQGEVMTPAEVAVFVRGAHVDAMVRLRRADEAAKDPTAVVPPLEQWLPILVQLAGCARSGG
jgi:predicted HD phosphohydrolase